MTHEAPNASVRIGFTKVHISLGLRDANPRCQADFINIEVGRGGRRCPDGLGISESLPRRPGPGSIDSSRGLLFLAVNLRALGSRSSLPRAPFWEAKGCGTRQVFPRLERTRVWGGRVRMKLGGDRTGAEAPRPSVVIVLSVVCGTRARRFLFTACEPSQEGDCPPR